MRAMRAMRAVNAAAGRPIPNHGKPWLTGLLLLGLLLASCGSEAVPSLEERAQRIDKQLVCPFCPAETIDQAQVPQAREMRAFVREKLSEGWTEQEILDYFSAPERYGPRVLAEPPKSGPTLTIWLLPPLGLLAGMALIFFTVKAMLKGREAPDADPPGDGPDTDPYLAQVDAEIQARREFPRPKKERSEPVNGDPSRG